MIQDYAIFILSNIHPSVVHHDKSDRTQEANLLMTHVTSVDADDSIDVIERERKEYILFYFYLSYVV